jgi:hypothetical protein
MVQKDKSNIESQILQLIVYADVNIECCKILENFYFNKLNKINKEYLGLSISNHFFQSIVTLNTLFHGKSDEISLSAYYKENNQSLLNKFHELQTLFNKGGFRNIRNNYVAHQNFKKVNNPIDFMLKVPSRGHIKRLDDIIKELKHKIFKLFPPDPIELNEAYKTVNGLYVMLDKLQEKS